VSARVLVVDDDAAVLRTLVTAMTRCGYVARPANSVAMAIDALDETVDVLLVDFHLGTESGLDVVRACRERQGRCVFIAMLTGEDDDETRILAAAAGADLVLAKPVSPAVLRAHVGEALARLRSLAA
jgi:NtrC-family two-component system response regulator AlgB